MSDKNKTVLLVPSIESEVTLKQALDSSGTGEFVVFTFLMSQMFLDWQGLMEVSSLGSGYLDSFCSSEVKSRSLRPLACIV